MTDDLRVNNTLRSNTIQAYNATKLTVNDELVVNETLFVDTITKRLANEVTVSGNFAVGDTLMVDTIDSSFASQISISNVVFGSPAVNKKLTVNGNLEVLGNTTFSGAIVGVPVGGQQPGLMSTSVCRLPAAPRRLQQMSVLLEPFLCCNMVI